MRWRRPSAASAESGAAMRPGFFGMVTATMPLDDVNRAFDLMHHGEAIRSVLLY